MLGLQLVAAFILIFAVIYFFGTIFPIISRNLLVPLTSVYIAFFMTYGKKLLPPALKSPDLKNFVKLVHEILGINMANIVYWFFLFALWMLAAGLSVFIFELFMRDRAGEILTGLENSLSLYGVRNILVIACFLIPVLLFLGLYYHFITDGMMFLGILCFAAAQSEVIYSSARHRTVKVSDKNILFLTSFSVVNALVLLIMLFALIELRK